MIKTIVFDFGGVYFTQGTALALPEIYRMVEVSEETVREVFTSHNRQEGWLYRKGMITREGFRKLAQLKLKISGEKLARLINLWHSSYRPAEGMEGLVLALKKRYRVIVFSGNIEERVEYLNIKYGLEELFDDFIFSFEFGFNKREKEFYDVLVQNIRCLPEECVCIDDQQRVLDEEKELGMHTILFQNADQVSRGLRRLGVKI